ncbi:ISXO2-like transposase domain protein [Leptospira interrogans str. UI 12621]|uniref:ISXO2-like transposase domain protein n=1 Tax=Leptospira interrogans str. UI 12621 TaxID=1049937 RepID=A0A0F6H707_LEPIR|nr:ISXO2-like transposase domain protein [Leptospira interrogans str. UI 12621]
MKIPQDLSLSITKISTRSALTKSPSRPKPLTSAQLKEKRNNPAINIDFFTNLTKKILNDFYPKYCPNCPDKLLTKEISTQPELIRCEGCRYLTSRLSYTPLHHMKLPLWMFSYVFYESMIQHPKVVTSTEISKRLKISYKGAAMLKRRFQVFASQQLPKYQKLTYDALDREFKDFSLPPDEDTDITEIMENRPYVCADTVVLYSASQRANQGRKRYRHAGSTASIYLSDKLGGRQVGTLAHTIAIKSGPVFFHSVPNQKMNTLGVIIKNHLPLQTPLMTDEGYPWLWGIYKSHRSVNHSARSSDARYRWARNRWSKNGVHNQVAEGNHRLLKTAFASYCYIRPENSTRYLNEFSFLKNAHVFGLDVICENGEMLAGDVDDAREMGRSSFGSDPRGSLGPAVGIGRKGYALRKNDLGSKNWFHSLIQEFEYFPETESSKDNVVFQSGFSLLNSPASLKDVNSLLLKEMKAHNTFWSDQNRTPIQRRKELKHQKTASKIWNLISEGKENGSYYSVSEVCTLLNIHKISAMLILRKWLKLRLIEKRRINQACYNRSIDFGIKKKAKEFPYLLYTNFKEKKTDESLKRLK